MSARLIGLNHVALEVGSVAEALQWYGRDIQFTKPPEVLRAMGLTGLEKSEAAWRELREKGIS